MAETVSALVAEITAQGAFDASSDDVLRWLNRRHKEMVGVARSVRKALDLGPTVADQQEYTVPAGVVEITDVTVGGLPYGKGRHADIALGTQGWLWLDGIGGVITESASSSEVTTVALIPAPQSAGDAIVANAAVLPPDLLLDDTVALRVDDDMIEGLLAGVFATALGRPNEARPDLAQTHLAIFQDACEKMRRRVVRRVRGSGPATIRTPRR